MEILNKKLFVLPIFLFLLTSCIGELDFTGFIRSTDRIEDRYENSIKWNETNPFKVIKVFQDDYQLLISSDLHIGKTKNYELFLERGLKPDITAMVFIGDIVTGKEEDYDSFNDLLPDFNIKPYFAITGNHELYFDGWKHFYRLFGSSIFYFSIKTPNKEDLYICLDSGSGTLGKSQMKWLKNLLESERNKYNNCIVFIHDNFFRDRHTGSTNPPVNELLVLVDLFEQYKISMVIMGHDHKRAFNQLGNTEYIILDALRTDNPNASYMILKRTNLGYKHEFVKI